MPKRRRKLSPDHEKQIGTALKEVELITAKINDIKEDDIRDEYLEAFSYVKVKADLLQSTYKEIGFNDESLNLMKSYVTKNKKRAID